MRLKKAAIAVSILSALAHPNRIRILECLLEGVHCICEMAPALRLEQSNLSRHLKILVQAGILKSSKVGLRVNFEVTDGRIFRIIDIAAAIARKGIEKKVEAFGKA